MGKLTAVIRPHNHCPSLVNTYAPPIVSSYNEKIRSFAPHLLSAGLVSNPASSPVPPLATMNKKKLKGQSPRNLLRVINAITVRNSNDGSDASSSISVEAPRPRGCLRFFLSHHSSSSNSKTPLYTTKSCRKPLNQLLL
ncbi:hypothetical protein ACFX2I_013656 [Malus domestica]